MAREQALNRTLVCFVALALGASGCTGADEATEVLPTSIADQETPSSASSSGSEPALQADIGDQPAETIGELEGQWAADRASVVEALSAESLGRSGSLLRGPGDLEVDLSQCPSEWTDEVAVGSSLTIGQIGNAADYDLVAEGMRAYFDHVNNDGGINGRRIDFVTVDDQRVPSKTIEAVEDLVAGAPPLAVTTFGTTSSVAAFDELNRQCIPQPFVGSAHPGWGAPISHPWTTGFQLAYSTEAVLWGSWIKRNLESELPVTVAAMTIDSDYGRAYRVGFETWAAKNRDVVKEVVVASHRPDGADLKSAMSELVDAEAEVVLALTAGSTCSAVLETIAGAAGIDSPLAVFVTSACAEFQTDLVPVGPAADGVLSISGQFKSTTDPRYGDDPFVVHINQILADAGIEDESGQAGIGAAQYGWAYVESLRIAAELDGGISRTNVLLALRGLKLRHPMLLGGISFSANGADDAYLIEGGRMQRYSVETGSWQPETLIVDLDGATPNCSWNGQDCT